MKILTKEILAQTSDTRITKIEIEAPLIAKKVQAGQFVLLMVTEKGERIPLTVVGNDPQRESITLIFQEVGYSTKILGTLNIEDSLYALVGPLGHPTPIKNYGRILVIGGGVGIAEILPVAKALKEAGNVVYSILGARTKELLILKNEIKSYSDNLYIATDDGSLGQKGFVSNILEKILKEDKDFQLVYCVGPVPMMKVVSNVTRPYKIKTLVCLNAIMLDATGMCGGCRLIEGGKVKFCCVDGPEFNGHEVDFDELMHRQGRFINEEKVSLRKLKHKCKLDSGKKK
ncbi:MAG: sulfide/dihydroorotate dehydrogenase-like FAD/NAD-binding protein [Candidatus Omnitrophota bacterium]|nr:MAG: sulfide/dihydroorotate dehydrogenase-like FAD/NAD-binding protein [Candidatus Omnitrophota bacterium]